MAVVDIFEKPGVPFSTTEDVYSTTAIGVALPTVETESVVNPAMGGGASAPVLPPVEFNALDPITAPEPFEGSPYSLNIASHFQNGAPQIFYSIFSGALPPGLSLGSGTGRVTGTPLAGGPGGAVVFRATDSRGANANSNSVVFAATAPAGSGTGLLDAYATGMWSACSLRRLAAGSGPCLRIRRADNLTEADIPFVTGAGGAVNAATLNAFVAGTTGQVVRLYDQTGAGNHFAPTAVGQLVWNGTGLVTIAGGMELRSANALPVSATLTVLARGILAATNSGNAGNAFQSVGWNDAANGMINTGSSANTTRVDIGGASASVKVGLWSPSYDISALVRTRMTVFNCGLVGNAACVYYTNGANAGLTQNYAPAGTLTTLAGVVLRHTGGGNSPYTFVDDVVWTTALSAANAAAIHTILSA